MTELRKRVEVALRKLAVEAEEDNDVELAAWLRTVEHRLRGNESE